MRHIGIILNFLPFVLIFLGSCQITVAPPEKEFFITKSWKLVKLQDGQIGEITTGLENYRLTFFEDGTLTHTDIDGEEYQGQWSLSSSKATIITVFYDYPDPDQNNQIVDEKEYRWTIIELELRRLRLNQELGDHKLGKYTRTYFLEAVPQ